MICLVLDLERKRGARVYSLQKQSYSYISTYHLPLPFMSLSFALFHVPLLLNCLCPPVFFSLYLTLSSYLSSFLSSLVSLSFFPPSHSLSFFLSCFISLLCKLISLPLSLSLSLSLVFYLSLSLYICCGVIIWATFGGF